LNHPINTIETPLSILLYPNITRRQFMRGTDPRKSNWVYPKL